MGLQKQDVLLFWVPRCSWVPQQWFKKYFSSFRIQFWSNLHDTNESMTLKLVLPKIPFLLIFTLLSLPKYCKNARKSGKSFFLEWKPRILRGIPLYKINFFGKIIHFLANFSPKSPPEGSFRFKVQICWNCENCGFGKGRSMRLQKQHVWLFWGPRCCWLPQKLFKNLFPQSEFNSEATTHDTTESKTLQIVGKNRHS